jgi:apolipoprotein N-acyltransferase
MTIRKDNSWIRQKAFMLAVIVLSGLCWYLANDLSGKFWFLMWITPVPVLYLCFKSTGRQAFVISFLSYLIGRLSWFSYLVSVATLVPAIVFTLLLPLIFSLIVIATRRIVIKTSTWFSVFAFPVLFTFYEWLFIRVSTDGTAGSIAYSQADFLPLVQIASVTGISGITFIVTLVPSVLALLFYSESKGIWLFKAMVPATLVIILVIAFGTVRMSHSEKGETMTVGLAVADEKIHFISDHADLHRDSIAAETYAKAISVLASKGAELVVLPERAVNMDNKTDSNIIAIFARAAVQSRVIIVFGYSNYRDIVSRNSAMVINRERSVVSDYNKVHLVKGFEQQFVPGSDIGMFRYSGRKIGIPICKDLDFPATIRKYGQNGMQFLSVPAWDFVKDDWLHSRMAVIRGVENGFSVIRTARLGRLTISNSFGKVKYEANSSDGEASILTGKINLYRSKTIFTRFGDWFGIVNAVVAGIFLIFGLRAARH